MSKILWNQNDNKTDGYIGKARRKSVYWKLKHRVDIEIIANRCTCTKKLMN